MVASAAGTARIRLRPIFATPPLRKRPFCTTRGPTAPALIALRPPGASTYLDGFAAAHRLRDADPAAFATLRHVVFGYRSVDTASSRALHTHARDAQTSPRRRRPPLLLLGRPPPPQATGWHLEAAGPVLSVDPFDEKTLTGVRHNDLDRLPPRPPASVRDVDGWRAAGSQAAGACGRRLFTAPGREQVRRGGARSGGVGRGARGAGAAADSVPPRGRLHGRPAPAKGGVPRISPRVLTCMRPLAAAAVGGAQPPRDARQGELQPAGRGRGAQHHRLLHRRGRVAQPVEGLLHQEEPGWGGMIVDIRTALSFLASPHSARSLAFRSCGRNSFLRGICFVYSFPIGPRSATGAAILRHGHRHRPAPPCILPARETGSPASLATVKNARVGLVARRQKALLDARRPRQRARIYGGALRRCCARDRAPGGRAELPGQPASADTTSPIQSLSDRCEPCTRRTRRCPSPGSRAVATPNSRAAPPWLA